MRVFVLVWQGEQLSAALGLALSNKAELEEKVERLTSVYQAAQKEERALRTTQAELKRQVSLRADSLFSNLASLRNVDCCFLGEGQILLCFLGTCCLPLLELVQRSSPDVSVLSCALETPFLNGAGVNRVCFLLSVWAAFLLDWRTMSSDCRSQSANGCPVSDHARWLAPVHLRMLRNFLLQVFNLKMDNSAMNRTKVKRAEILASKEQQLAETTAALQSAESEVSLPAVMTSLLVRRALLCSQLPRFQMPDTLLLCLRC